MAAQVSNGEWLTNLEFVTIETFVIQFVILLVVLWVLNKFIFRPYLDNAESILEEKRREGDNLLEKARAKWNTVIEEAEAMAVSKKEAIISDAERQASDTTNAAKAQIEKERESMLSGIKSQVIDMALKLNSKLFKDEKVSKDFLEKNIDTL